MLSSHTIITITHIKVDAHYTKNTSRHVNKL